MPCSGGDYTASDLANAYASDASRKAKDLEAMLWGLMTVLDAQGALSKMLQSYNSTESGVEVRQLQRWWAEHKEKDVGRRAYEAAHGK